MWNLKIAPICLRSWLGASTNSDIKVRRTKLSFNFPEIDLDARLTQTYSNN